jgi:hypothetical protein
MHMARTPQTVAKRGPELHVYSSYCTALCPGRKLPVVTQAAEWFRSTECQMQFVGTNEVYTHAMYQICIY